MTWHVNLRIKSLQNRDFDALRNVISLLRIPAVESSGDVPSTTRSGAPPLRLTNRARRAGNLNPRSTPEIRLSSETSEHPRSTHGHRAASTAAPLGHDDDPNPERGRSAAPTVSPRGRRQYTHLPMIVCIQMGRSVTCGFGSNRTLGRRLFPPRLPELGTVRRFSQIVRCGRGGRCDRLRENAMGFSRE
jgi:hypothetical protein